MPINLYLNYEREKIGLSPPKRWDLITTEDKPLTSGVTNSVKAIRDVFDYPIGSPRIEVLGKPLDGSYLTNLGISVLKTEKKFDGAAGFTRKDNRLPKFFLEGKLPPSGNAFDVPEEEIDTVYAF
jgi:hypothetical protein